MKISVPWIPCCWSWPVVSISCWSNVVCVGFWVLLDPDGHQSLSSPSFYKLNMGSQTFIACVQYSKSSQWQDKLHVCSEICVHHAVKVPSVYVCACVHMFNYVSMHIYFSVCLNVWANTFTCVSMCTWYICACSFHYIYGVNVWICIHVCTHIMCVYHYGCAW